MKTRNSKRRSTTVKYTYNALVYWGEAVEKSIPGAIRKAGETLFHIHIADSNRAAPGEGHLDFKPIVKAIREIEYIWISLHGINTCQC